MTDKCYGCGCPNHRCEPNESGDCYAYCTSCHVELVADATEAEADWFMERLQVMRDTNPALVIELLAGGISFDDANTAVIAMTAGQHRSDHDEPSF